MRVLTKQELNDVAGAYLDTSAPWFLALSPEEQQHLIAQEAEAQQAADDNANDAWTGANDPDAFIDGDDWHDSAWWQ